MTNSQKLRNFRKNPKRLGNFVEMESKARHPRFEMEEVKKF